MSRSFSNCRARVCIAVGIVICSRYFAFGQPPPLPGWTWQSPFGYFVDKHALEAPVKAEASVADLAGYLSKPARVDGDKTRAFYRWIADRITFNPDDEHAKKLGDPTPEKVLRARACNSEGFVRLYLALCAEANIEAVRIPGHLKGQDAKPDHPLKTNHVWAAVKLGKRWSLVDPALAANDTKAEKKRFHHYYYRTPADRLVFSHFPEDAKHQFLEKPITEKQFQQRLVVPAEFVKFGVPIEDIQARLDDPAFRGFVKMTWDDQIPILIERMPLDKHLKKGQPYTWRFAIPSRPKVMISGLDAEVGKNGNFYHVDFTPKADRVTITAHLPRKGPMLEYVAE